VLGSLRVVARGILAAAVLGLGLGLAVAEDVGNAGTLGRFTT